MKVAEIENNILVVKEREDEKLDGRKGALVKVLVADFVVLIL